MASISFRRVMALLALAMISTFVWAGAAQAAVTVSRADVSGDRLRIEGQAAASRTITVDGVAMATSSSSGTFRIERSGYRSPADCTVDVDDGAGPIGVRLSGCTVTASPPPAPSPSLASAALSPSSVLGGATSSLTVSLTAAAPSGGAVVTLTSNAAAATVPATLTVPSGSSSGSATVSTTSVATSTTATVTATYAGVSRSATLTVTPEQPAPAPEQPAVALAGLSISPSTLEGGGSISMTVTLTAPAPSGGAAVSVTSSDPALVPVQSPATVPEGVDSRVVFPPQTQPVSVSTTVTVTAAYGSVTRAATVTLTPPPPPPPPPSTATLDGLTLSPATVQTGTTGTSATLLFSAPTPDGGAVVQLTSSNPSLATVPASVTVPGRSSTGAFPVTINASGSGTAQISGTYDGVTRSAVLTVQTQTLFRIITESPLPNARVGQNYAGFIEACCGQGTPYRWSLVSGTVPDGLRFAGDSLRLSRTTGVTGVPTHVQTTTFTVRARDGAGNTATKTFTLTVDPAAPLEFNSPSQLTTGRVGASYFANLFASGGVTPYRWTRVAGALPPGLSLQASPGRISGTPTAAGTYVFTLRVDDSGGQSRTGDFTITITPA
jgi:hypothetical protein